jgi:hypothetical protein
LEDPVDVMKRVFLFLCLLSVTVAGLTVLNAAPASAGLSPTRQCRNFTDGDRRLSVCARVWISDPPTQSRGVVEMHTYAWVHGRWIDAMSQSITLNDGLFLARNDYVEYGQVQSPRSCRVNGPSSSHITCSVPNTTRVAFYSTAFNGVAQSFENNVLKVSWRDDRGQPHIEEEYPFPLITFVY